MRETAVLDALEALERYAHALDQISAETDAHYSARALSAGCARDAATDSRFGAAAS